MPFKFNPFTGILDLVRPTVDDDDNSIVEKTYTAGEDLSALVMVKIDNPTTVSLADKTLIADAQTIGITTNAALTGSDVQVVTFGQVNDASFTFAANDCLFLNLNGSITDIAPTTGHNVPIGKALGAGAIFIDIDNLTIL